MVWGHCCLIIWTGTQAAGHRRHGSVALQQSQVTAQALHTGDSHQVTSSSVEPHVLWSSELQKVSWRRSSCRRACCTLR